MLTVKDRDITVTIRIINGLVEDMVDKLNELAKRLGELKKQCEDRGLSFKQVVKDNVSKVSYGRAILLANKYLEGGDEAVNKFRKSESDRVKKYQKQTPHLSLRKVQSDIKGLKLTNEEATDLVRWIMDTYDLDI